MVQALVTGGTGFIGSILVQELLRAEQNVTVLTRRSRTTFPNAVNVTHGDISLPRTVSPILFHDEIDVVYHLAGISRIRDSDDYIDVNVGGTSNILAAVRSKYERTGKSTKLVFASSRAVYSPSQAEPLLETYQTEPTTPYGASKLAAERLIHLECKTGAIGATSLRCFNVAGAAPGFPDRGSDRLVPRLIGAICGTSPPIQIGNDHHRRDFVHVVDVARAFMASAVLTEPGAARTYNIGSGTSTCLREVIRILEDISRTAVPLALTPPTNEPDSNAGYADIALARTQLDWRPAHDITSILKTAWQFSDRGRNLT